MAFGKHQLTFIAASLGLLGSAHVANAQDAYLQPQIINSGQLPTQAVPSAPTVLPASSPAVAAAPAAAVVQQSQARPSAAVVRKIKTINWGMGQDNKPSSAAANATPAMAENAQNGPANTNMEALVPPALRPQQGGASNLPLSHFFAAPAPAAVAANAQHGPANTNMAALVPPAPGRAQSRAHANVNMAALVPPAPPRPAAMQQATAGRMPAAAGTNQPVITRTGLAATAAISPVASSASVVSTRQPKPAKPTTQMAALIPPAAGAPPDAGAATTAAAAAAATTAVAAAQPAPAAPAPTPAPAVQPSESAVSRLFDFQASGQAAGQGSFISGRDATASYKAFLQGYAQARSAAAQAPATTSAPQAAPAGQAQAY